MIKRFGILNSLIVLIGVAALGYLIYQVWFGLGAVVGTAVVESYETRRRGQGEAVLTYEVLGQPVEAKLRVWLLDLEKGQQVAILYRPEKPESVQLDNFRQRYAPSVALVLFAAAVVGWELRKQSKRGSAGRLAAAHERA